MVINLTSLVDSDGAHENKSKSKQNLSNWKTKICYMWASGGTCRFGSNCSFTHGYGSID